MPTVPPRTQPGFSAIVAPARRAGSERGRCRDQEKHSRGNLHDPDEIPECTRLKHGLEKEANRVVNGKLRESAQPGLTTGPGVEMG